MILSGEEAIPSQIREAMGEGATVSLFLGECESFIAPSEIHKHFKKVRLRGLLFPLKQFQAL